MGYWENRQAQIMYEQMEDAEKVARELADIYAKATRELNYQIGEIFDRFTDKHNLTEDEARRLLGMMKDPADIATLREALAKDPKNAALLAELESPAYRARIERLENLQNEIDRMMQEIYGQEKMVTSEHYANVFHNSYYRGIYEIQRQAGFQFSFSTSDAQSDACNGVGRCKLLLTNMGQHRGIGQRPEGAACIGVSYRETGGRYGRRDSK